MEAEYSLYTPEKLELEKRGREYLNLLHSKVENAFDEVNIPESENDEIREIFQELKDSVLPEIKHFFMGLLEADAISVDDDTVIWYINPDEIKRMIQDQGMILVSDEKEVVDMDFDEFCKKIETGRKIVIQTFEEYRKGFEDVSDEEEYEYNAEDEATFRMAHADSFGSGEIVKARKQKCGCFNCLKIFDSDRVNFIEERNGKETPVCPYCGIDSVLCEDNGYPLTARFLKGMEQYYME